MIHRVLSFGAASALLAAATLAQYSVSSSGAVVIPSGAPGNTGGTGATWPGTFPSALASNVIPLATPVPAGASNIKRIKLNALYHSWIGDLHFVLSDPAGNKYCIVHRPGSTGAAVGFSANYGTSGTIGANYTFVDAADPAVNQAWPFSSPGSGVYLPAGVYAQEFGLAWGPGWPSGTNGVANTPISAIPASPGVWSLTIYDWAGGDTGTLASWTLEGDTGPVVPVSYCTSGTTTNGCVAVLTANSNPSVSLANACVLSVANVEGQKSGLVFYGLARLAPATPWCGGGTSFLCVKAPTQRMSTQSSGGTTNQCDGALTQDWNAFQVANPTALGNPWAAGNTLDCQAWFRDPLACKTTSLSDAIEMTYQP